MPEVDEYFINRQYYEDQIGMLGTGNAYDDFVRSPELVSKLDEASSVAVGDLHACAISKGKLYCWGAAENSAYDSDWRLNVSQTGLGPDRKWTAEPTLVKGLENMVSVSASRYGTCALDRDGKAWCFGFNGHGQLGNGQIDDGGSTVPVEVQWNE
ncbi:MAG: hypothetical protein IJ523_09335 [Succinivibrionaceae bacterium]|nr:hypothetical protein [Succinivibrionaceae bacterium]